MSTYDLPLIRTSAAWFGLSGNGQGSSLLRRLRASGDGQRRGCNQDQLPQ